MLSTEGRPTKCQKVEEFDKKLSDFGHSFKELTQIE